MKKETIEDLKMKLERKKTGNMTDIDKVKRIFDVGRYVTQQASEYPEKVFVLQEIKFRHKKLTLLRLGYYIIGKQKRFRDKWVWGQFCPFIVGEDLKKLISKAEREGIL
jgi:hypothetical protein